MCGIAVIVSGIRIDISSIVHQAEPRTPTNHHQQHDALFSLDDLKSSLQRRGPDSLGTKTLTLQSKSSTSLDKKSQLLSVTLVENDNEKTLSHNCANEANNTVVQAPNSVAELQFFGSILQLRGLHPVIQPFLDSLHNILVYNGEIFGGIDVDSDSNDGEVLMETLGNCCSCNSHEHTTSACSSSGEVKNSIPDVLSAIKGPWALIYWQDSSRTLWFGRDALGRRSLLVHWPNEKDSRFLLSSVSPFPCVDHSSDFEVENGTNLNYWEELSCGIYSLSMDASNGCLVGEAKKHEWANSMLQELIKWERVSVEPNFSHHKPSMGWPKMHLASSDIIPFESGLDQTSVALPAQKVLTALRKSMMLRISQHKNFQAVRCDRGQDDLVPVAVLFSGGLDSMILAALLDECLDPSYGIDLLNVSFDCQSAPDRISAKQGLKELRRIAPLRRWKLVEIDADLTNLTLEMKHVMSLITPANTYMDLNIGIALWLAASGDGWVSEQISNDKDESKQRSRYKSRASIVIVGSGADEQCAGYGRHRTKYRCGSWLGLNEEMKLDMQRIWKRNMGRDDRCIADNGKEARFPFLDEDVIRTLLDIPLWEVANLEQASGTGDKKILREVAQMLGLYEAAVLPKRAIQFGSRIARESNRKNFGSNRAANQVSAGSAVINMP